MAQARPRDLQGTAVLSRRYSGLAGGDAKTEAGKRRLEVFWIYWDTAWSLIISGIMFTTIVTHPDAEFVEIQAARRAK